jgi:CheY-like chemotaxis protein
MENFDSLRILIVGDDESFQKTLATVLSQKGNHQIEKCESHEMAIEALKQNNCNVVILDAESAKLGRMQAGEAKREHVIIENYQRTIDAIAVALKTSLTILISEAREHEEGNTKEVRDTFRGFREEVEVIAAGVRSLVAVSNLIASRYSRRYDTVQSLRDPEPVDCIR